MCCTSKTDLVKKQELDKLIAIIKTLNTDAHVIPISHGKIDIDKILDTNLSTLPAEQAPGWLKEMRASTSLKQKNMG